MKEAAGPYLEFERTGGFVGWNQRLRLSSDGAWTVESRVDGRELAHGAFDGSTMKRLSGAIDAVPKAAHGAFDAKGADYVNYRLVLIQGPLRSDAVSGPWLSGRSGIPGEWRPVIEILEAPFDSLRPDR